MLSGASFPKELRDKAFGRPDKPFVVVLSLVMVFICGLTFILSLREPPAVTETHIVKIQDRYAKLVLDAFEIEKRKKKKAKEKPPEPEIKKPVEIPKPKKEEPKVEKKEEIKIEIPKVVERKVKKYEIRKEKVQIAEVEEKVSIETLPELPDVLDKKSDRYGSKRDSAGIGLDDDLDSSFKLGNQGPHIDVSRSSRYGGAGRSRNRGLDLEEESTTLKSNEPQIDTRTVKRYKSRSGSRGGAGTAPVVADMDDKKVLLAKRATGPKVVVGKRYGGGSYKKSIPADTGGNSLIIKEKGAILKKNGKMASLPEMANIQNLEACVDPNEEKRLKKQIVTYAVESGTCSDKWGHYAYLSTEMFSTLEVRFVSRGKKKYNRCEALNRALQCLINKNKR